LDKNAAGEVTQIRVKLLPDTTGKDSPEGVVCKAAIHWVDATTAVDAEVRLYDRLFTVEDPDAAEGGFLSVLNPDSVKTVIAKVEASLLNEAPGYSCQFERNGYFITDMKDHVPGKKAVFNRTVALKDSWGKGK
jgi:glutaminyl-tRNA synthetase